MLRRVSLAAAAVALASAGAAGPELLPVEGDVSPVHDPVIMRQGGNWYLFATGGSIRRSQDLRHWSLCGRVFENSRRGSRNRRRQTGSSIVVGRSRSITGPYVDASGTPMMEGGGTQLIAGTSLWRGPGHEGLLPGAPDLMVFHAYDGATGRPRLQISTIAWDGGWPHIAALPGEPLP